MKLKQITLLLILTLLFVLILTLLFGANASGESRVKFGDSYMLLPEVEGLCLLGNHPNEKIAFEYFSELQFSSGNKLLQYWVNCKVQKKIKDGSSDAEHKDWVMVLGQMSAQKEETFPKYDPEKYKKSIKAAWKDLDIHHIQEQFNSLSKNQSKKHFDNLDLHFQMSDTINLGILSETDSVHTGVIMKVEGSNKPVASVTGVNLIKGIPMSFNFYSSYENKDTIRRLLLDSEHYSAKLINMN